MTITQEFSIGASKEYDIVQSTCTLYNNIILYQSIYTSLGFITTIEKICALDTRWSQQLETHVALMPMPLNNHLRSVIESLVTSTAVDKTSSDSSSKKRIQ